MHISIPMVYIILRDRLSSEMMENSIVRIQRFVKDSGAEGKNGQILIAFCGGAWYNIKAARQHAAVKRSLSMQETAFFKF